jgi:hypothetical protein
MTLLDGETSIGVMAFEFFTPGLSPVPAAAVAGLVSASVMKQRCCATPWRRKSMLLGRAVGARSKAQPAEHA